MSVLMPDRGLAVRRRAGGVVDSHGWPIGGDWGPVIGPWPGRAREAADGSWSLATDPGTWPVTAGDLVVEPGTTRAWLVLSAQLIRNNADSSVDYVRVDGRQRTETADTETVVTPIPTTRAV